MTKDKDKEKDKKTCPSCGAAMVFETREDHVTYAAHRRAFEVEGHWCTSCDEAIFEGPSLTKAERVFIELRAEVDGVMLPEQVAKVRERLNMSQREASALLGGGPRAFQKYESGRTPVSVPMNNLLTLLGNDPSRVHELHESKQRRSKRKSG